MTDEGGTVLRRPPLVCKDDEDSAGVFVRPVWLPGRSPMELAAKVKAERAEKKRLAEAAEKKKQSRACVVL